MSLPDTAEYWQDVKRRGLTWDRKPKSNRARAERHKARMGHEVLHDNTGWVCLNCSAGRGPVAASKGPRA